MDYADLSMSRCLAVAMRCRWLPAHRSSRCISPAVASASFVTTPRDTGRSSSACVGGASERVVTLGTGLLLRRFGDAFVMSEGAANDAGAAR